MAIVSMYSAINAGVSLYKLTIDSLADIKRDLDQMYIDIAESHLASAQQSFLAGSNSRDPDAEVRSGINHLRDVFNIYTSMINRKKKVRLGFFSTEEIIPTPPRGVLLKLIDVSTLITLSYRYLNEEKNADTWKKKALHTFERYRSRTLDIPFYFKIFENDYHKAVYFELLKIDDKYVRACWEIL